VRQAAQVHNVNSLWVFDPEKWLQDEEPVTPGCVLPAEWTVTSDSIAARLAQCLDADELVLIKSSLPEDDAMVYAAAEGYVDSFFVTVASSIRVIRCVDLRGSGEMDRVEGPFRAVEKATTRKMKTGHRAH
jgi:hypothetical protein